MHRIQTAFRSWGILTSILTVFVLSAGLTTITRWSSYEPPKTTVALCDPRCLHGVHPGAGADPATRNGYHGRHGKSVPALNITDGVHVVKSHPNLTLAPRSNKDRTIRLRQEQGELAGRRYASYDEYTANQKAKLSKAIAADGAAFIRTVDQEMYEIYNTLFATIELRHDDGFAGKTVLCLAARLGGEVRAFNDIGALAVGVDLNPGKENRYVLTGDFHHLQFADGVFDYVFTNAMDHAFDISAVAKEVCRVLRTRDGFFILDIGGVATAENPTPMKPRQYESTNAAAHPDALVARFVDQGFRKVFSRWLQHPKWNSLLTTLAPDACKNA